MGTKEKISRRDFIKLTAGAGAGLAAGKYLFYIGNANAAEFRKIGNVNPFIPNNRVVHIHDTRMTTGDVIKDWAGQNKATNANLVGQNMDRIVCMLSQEKSPKNAWEKIFLKPRNKSWKEIVVAIKTNNIAQQHTRNAVMTKICNVLVNGFGISGENVHIYDGCHGGDIKRKSPFEKLPDGVNIEGNWGGINTEADVPDPFGAKIKCVSSLAKDEVDILINIAMCKGHSGTFGGFTMTMKNHFGTFAPGHGHGKNGLGFLTGINKSEAILGAIDEKTAKVIQPRQQLCIIDALWASKPGPEGPPTHCTNRLFMGTFPPILDYMVATDFRRDTMEWQVNDRSAERFLTDFGYTKKDLPNGGKMISAI